MFHGQAKPGGVVAVPQAPAPRPKVRARRGQATDPHSIAERVMSNNFIRATHYVHIHLSWFSSENSPLLF